MVYNNPLPQSSKHGSLWVGLRLSEVEAKDLGWLHLGFPHRIVRIMLYRWYLRGPPNLLRYPFDLVVLCS